MNITINQDKLRQLKQMGQQFPVAGAAALNRMAKMAKTEISDEIRRDYNIKKSDLDPFIVLTPASARSLRAVLRTSTGRIPLGKFLRGVTGSTKCIIKKFGGTGIPVAVRKGSIELIQKGFEVRTRYGPGVFVRVGKKRPQIKALYGPGVAQLFGSKYMRDVIQRLVNTKFGELLMHEIDFRLKRANTTDASGNVYGSQGELTRRGSST
jgi:hypothetical protein